MKKEFDKQLVLLENQVHIDKLDLEGDSSDEEKRLCDDDIAKLAQALSKNDKFQGELDLSNNNLTDLVSFI